MLAPLHPISRYYWRRRAWRIHCAHGPALRKMLRLLSDKSPVELREFA